MSDPDPTVDGEGDPEAAAAEVPTDRESPVGEPVVRGDRAVSGDRAADAVAFAPDDPEDRRRAARTVAAFAAEDAYARGNLDVLEGAAAAAALVRGEGSYRAAADRAGEDVSVSFVRKWARVHDLPRSIRRQVAAGHLAPSAAKHVARLSGDDRLTLAWAAVDHELPVREVRSIASEVADGGSVVDSLADRGVRFGVVEARLPPDLYCELRRRVDLSEEPPGEVVARALSAHFSAPGE
jgi:hypothetical protein